MWNTIKSIKVINHQPFPPILLFNNNILSIPSDITESFTQHFKNTAENNIINEIEINFHQQNNNLNIPFNKNEFFNALSRCKSKRPDLDSILFSFIQYLPTIGHDLLLQIFNIIWDKGIYFEQ